MRRSIASERPDEPAISFCDELLDPAFSGLATTAGFSTAANETDFAAVAVGFMWELPM
jgi:hypothetical protein